MRDWWAQREPREQLILLGAAVVLTVLLFFIMIWEPLYKGLHQQRAEIREQQQLAEWLLEIRPQVQAAGGARTPANDGRSMLAVVDTASRAAGLAPQVKRIQPEGDTTVRVWIDDAPLQQVLRWIQTLHDQQGIRTTNLNMDRGKKPGTATARLTLER
ncbi:MAG: type II secretion system protein M [Oceanococcaceae bacterium]